uniref:Cell death inducing DFFA like effector a n=1 Tax=Podarcis muralis TaxID=64176 RepID=A0A670IJW9_PODMU
MRYMQEVNLGTNNRSVTRQTLFAPLPAAARPFRVCNHDRSSRRGVVASTLEELISKTLDTLMITAGLITLVLEEDGTVVDTEDFFQSLGDNTHFMVLEKGQKWKPVSVVLKIPKKMGVANITFDLYKVNPKDFIGCLNIKATFYEIYSVTYDIQCMGTQPCIGEITPKSPQLNNSLIKTNPKVRHGASFQAVWNPSLDKVLSKAVTVRVRENQQKLGSVL